MTPGLVRRLVLPAALSLAALAACGTVAREAAAPPPSPQPPPRDSAAACAAEPMRTAGTIHYACDCGPGADPRCVPGDDGNPGTSPTAPWRTFAMLRAGFSSMEAGDTLALCRGGRFAHSAGRWVNYRCRAATPCVLRDYSPPWGDGTEAKPLVVGGGLDFENGGAARHREGYRVINLAFRASPAGTGWGVFVYNDLDDVTVCNCDFDAFQIGVHVAGANWPPRLGSDGHNDRISIVGCRITNSTRQGYLGAGDGNVVRGNTFVNNGSDGILDHSIYLESSRDGTGGRYQTSNESIVDNQIHAGWNGLCRGSVVVVHGQHRDTLIAGNTITAEIGQAGPGCYGIDVTTGGYESPGWFRNMVIRGNVVRNTGTTGIDVSSCSGCVIENNLVVMEQDSGKYRSGLTGIWSGLYPHRETTPRGPADEVNTRTTIRNNTVYLGPLAYGGGIRITAEGTGHAATGNAIAYAGSGHGIGWTCLDLSLSPPSYRMVDRNLCWAPNVPPGTGGWGHGRVTLAKWRAATGLDRSSLEADPEFVDPGTDFTPGPTSPALRAADPLEAPAIDIGGKSRGGRPDIGAYQR